MIRMMKETDIDNVCEIINENWKKVYKGYVNSELLSPAGCADRICELKKRFFSGRLKEYVWEEKRKRSSYAIVWKYRRS